MVKAKVKTTKSAAATVPAEVPAKKKAKKASSSPAPAIVAAPATPAAPDLLSQTVLLCQAQRWREAAGICRRVLDRARNDGNVELEQSLTGALSKIEYSLRRQMAAAAVAETRRLLAEEFLLDVAS